MRLTDPMRDFVIHWGEMGQRWGVNRSQAQVHALLHLAARPLPADEVAETLKLARSNVSTALRELQEWGLVRIERMDGDRRDFFLAVDDMFVMVSKIIEGRRAREFAPTIERVRECRDKAKDDDATDPAVEARLTETLKTMEMFDAWYREMASLPRETQMMLLKVGARIARFLPKAVEEDS